MSSCWIIRFAVRFFWRVPVTMGFFLIHGFTATPGTMNPLGQALAQKTGYTISAPLLPGHGRTPEEMAKTRWHDWLRAVQHEFDLLSRRCRDVSVVGLSMGGTLTLLLAESRPVRRAVPIAAALSVYNEKLIFSHALWPFVPFLPSGTGIRKSFLISSMNTTIHTTKRRYTVCQT